MAKIARAVDPNLELFSILPSFPALDSESALTGIARLAAESSGRRGT